MSTLQDSDLFVVERETTNYQVRSDEVSTLEETDLFVVEREGVNYKVESKYVVKGNTGTMEKPVEVLTPFNGAGLNEGEPYEPLSSRITAVGAGGEVVYATDTISSVEAVGEWNTSETWTNKTILAGTDARTPNRIFDTDFSNWASGENNNFAAYFTDFPATTTVDGIKVRMQSDDGCKVTFLFESGSFIIQDLSGGRDDNPLEWTVECPIGTVLTGIQCYKSSATGNTRIMEIKIDGRSLVDDTYGSSNPPTSTSVLTFPTDNNFDKFEVGDVVNKPYKITAIDTAVPSITVNGGLYQGSDGSGDSTTYAYTTATGDVNSVLDGTITDDTLLLPEGGVFEINNIDNYIANTVAVNANGIDSTAELYVTDSSGIEHYLQFSCPGVKRDSKKCAESGGTWCDLISQPNQWFTITFDTPTEITRIKVYGSGTAGYINGFKVNDAAVSTNTFSGAGGGIKDLDKAVTSEATLTFVDDKQLDMMVGPVTMVNENGDIFRPQTSAITSKASGFNTYFFLAEGVEGLNSTADLSAYSPETTLNILSINSGKNGDQGTKCTGTLPGDGGSGGNQGYVYLQETTVGSNPNYSIWANDGGGSIQFGTPALGATCNNGYGAGCEGAGAGSFSVPQMPELSFQGKDGGSKGDCVGGRGGGGDGGGGGTRYVASGSWDSAVNGDFPTFTTPNASKGGDGSMNNGRQGFGGGGGTGWGAGGGGGAGSAENQGGCGSNGGGGPGAKGSQILQVPTYSTYVFENTEEFKYFSVGDSVTSGDSTGVVTYVDSNTASMQINFDVEPEVGASITGRAYQATANDVDYSNGNVLGVSNITGTWITELFAQGSQVNRLAPDPNDVIFTSMNGGTTAFTGKDASLTTRIWELQVGNTAQGPWTSLGSYSDLGAAITQNGATPWEDHPALEYNKFYQVRVTYDSNNANSETSTFNTFKTGYS